MSVVAPATAGTTGRLARLRVIGALLALYLGSYLLVTRFSASLPAAAVRDFALPIDARIPYVAWTWPFYWLAYPFVVLGGGGVLLALPRHAFRPAAMTVAALTLVGMLVQLALPSRAPWPDDPVAAQQLMHGAGLMLPFAAFPSMHVAYCALVSGFSRLTPGGRVRSGAGWLVTALVAVATLTQKEHYVLDALAGLALAGTALAWWRRQVVSAWA